MASTWNLKRALLILVLASGAWICQNQALRLRGAALKIPFAFGQKTPATLSKFSLVGALGGNRMLAADWIYIDFLQYYGDRKNLRDGRYSKLYPIFDELLWLDPYFHFAVTYGAGILCWNVERVDEASKLLRRAIELDPAYRRYKLYLAAFTYKKLNRDQESIRYLEALVLQPDRPENLVRILGNLYLKNGQWLKARQYWTWALAESTDDLTLRQAKMALENAAQHGY